MADVFRSYPPRGVAGRSRVSRASRGAELFGQHLVELRRMRKLTQRAVARRVGCSQSHLSTIEWGDRVPNLLMIIRLALALECTVTDLTRCFDRADLQSLLPESGVARFRRKRGSIA